MTDLVKTAFWRRTVIFLLIVFMIGCAASSYQYREASYEVTVEEGTVLQGLSFPAELEARILALDPEHIDETAVKEVLVQVPAPRMIKIRGGLFPNASAMESFSNFLIGMGYPEGKIRHPRDGSYSYSSYGSSERLAGEIAWYYEKEGVRVNLVGQSAGGVQVVKVLYQLAGTFNDKISVWNPLTGKQENRYSIIDPLTGDERPVVGVQIGYATAVGAGGLAMVLPNSWSMIGKVRGIPDTVDFFTGFYKTFDGIGGISLSANVYHPNGMAKVRNVKLPQFGHGHFTVPFTDHLAKNKAIRDWIYQYVPTNEPELPDEEFDADSQNILWAADVWHSIKKQWCLEAQRLIRAKRDMKGTVGRRGVYVHSLGQARVRQVIP